MKLYSFDAAVEIPWHKAVSSQRLAVPMRSSGSVWKCEGSSGGAASSSAPAWLGVCEVHGGRAAVPAGWRQTRNACAVHCRLTTRPRGSARMLSSVHQHIAGDPERHWQHCQHPIYCAQHGSLISVCSPVRCHAGARSDENVIEIRLLRSPWTRRSTIAHGLMSCAAWM